MNLVRIGMIMVLMGIAMIFIGSFISGPQFGGMVVIGFIPLVFGSSPEMTVITMVLGAIIMLLFYFIVRRL